MQKPDQNGGTITAACYLMFWQRPHSRQILELCSSTAMSSAVPVASSRRVERTALRHFLTGTSWNKCFRKISAKRPREKHWVSKLPPTSPAVGPLGRIVSVRNSLRNKINFDGNLNHGAGGFPPTYLPAPCQVEGRRLSPSRAFAAPSTAHCSGQAFALHKPAGMRNGGGHSPLPSPGYPHGLNNSPRYFSAQGMAGSCRTKVDKS